jgi:hypothetical protein
MTDVIQFPGAPSERALTDDSDRRHSQAFRDLEGRLSDCQSMAKIAAQLMTDTPTMDGELVFAVCNTAGMLTALQADYYAAWNGEKQIEP